ncbi:MAG: carbohydrate binding domain-containing protein [Oscillospiraceae bacterium]|nr:carbohydrate binding domain-containing protein [Oscillospiraceae bacterium]
MKRKAFLLAAMLCVTFCAGCGKKNDESSRKRRKDSDAESISSADEQSSGDGESDGDSLPDSAESSDALAQELKSGGPYYAYDSESDCYLILKFGSSDHYLFDDADYIIRGYDKSGGEKVFYWQRTYPDSCWSEGYISGGTENSVELKEPGYIRGSRTLDYYRYMTFTKNSDGSWDDSEGHTYLPGQPGFSGGRTEPAQTDPTQTEPSGQSSSQSGEVICDWEKATKWDRQLEDGASATITLPQSNQDILSFDIYRPGPNPWSVQGKYLNITLEKGYRYRVSFEYKTELFNENAGYDPDAHHALVSLVQNYDPWEPYFEATLKLNRSEFTNASYEFNMDSPTDSNVFCGFGFGGIGSTGCHAEIRNFKIEKIDVPILSSAEVIYDWRDIMKWDYQVEDGASATVTLPEPNQDGLCFDISRPGPNPWSVQGKYLDVALHQGSRYRVSFEYKASTYNESAGYDQDAHHALVSLIQNYEPWNPYFEATLKLNRNTFTKASFEFTMDAPTDYNVFCGFGFGGIGNTSCYAEIRDFKIEKIS